MKFDTGEFRSRCWNVRIMV